MIPESLRAELADRYDIERPLGEGGMATVYLALDRRHERKVAIKVMRPELAESLGGERFLREIRIAAQLAHPHIVGLLDSGQVGEGRESLLYYVMPYMAGETLRALITRDGQQPLKLSVRIISELADALAKAHSLGFVHRDIKPDNIFITDGHAALADFGIARALSSVRNDGLTPPRGTLATAFGVSVGTPAYMAPEQAAADPSTDHRADIYSLGVVAYEMLAGKPLFEGVSAHQLVVAQLTQLPEPLEARRPGLPPALAAIVMRCLEKDPARRFQSAKDLCEALENVPLTDASSLHATLALPRAPSRPLAPPRASRLIPPRPALAIGAVLLAVLLGWLALRTRGSKSLSDIPPQSLAVLPLTNLSGDTTNNYFSDGISEEILTAVSRIPGLRVAARTSSFALRGTSMAPADIGRRLKVRNILDGSIERAGGRVRVRARLTDASTGEQLWGERFDKPEGDLFLLQDEVADAVASALTRELGGATAPSLTGGTRDATAQDSYLKGRQELRNRTGPDALRAAIAHFDAAIARDSNYARAWAGLATAQVLLPEYAAGTPLDAERRSRAAIDRALALDSASAEAHAALGYLRKSYLYDWAGAEASYRRAIAIDPNDANTHQWLGEMLATVGRPTEAVAELDRAVLLDPESPVVHLARGSQALAAGDRSLADREFARALELGPGLWSVRLQQLWLAMEAGDARADSLATMVAGLFHDDPATYRQLVAASRDSSQRPAALLLLKLWSEQGRAGFLVANWYAALGEHDRALATLAEVVHRHEPYSSYTPWWPFFRKLRVDPRWQDILRGLKLEPARA